MAGNKPKLNQIIAVLSGKKTKATEETTSLYKTCQKPVLFDGLSRSYRPLEEAGEPFPPENKNIQYTVKQVLAKARATLTEVWNLTATQDLGNCQAIVDVKIDDTVIIRQLPVTHLLYLEKQLDDLRTLISSLPVLDTAETWTWSDAADCYKSEPTQKFKTKKNPKSFEKSPATDKHPAQVELYYEDERVGTWTEIRQSGAIEAKVKNAMLERLNALRDAVKVAREEANSLLVEKADYADDVFDYILNGV